MRDEHRQRATRLGGASDDLPLNATFEITGDLLELDHRVAFITPVEIT